MREFRDRVAVVTGGASGVGCALGRRLASEGMRLVLADVEKSALDATVSKLTGEGCDVTGIVADVSDYASVESLARQVFDSYPTVHVLCNNAGVGTDETRTRIWEAPANDWAWTFRVNVWGVIHGIRAFVPTMIERGEEGQVINTSSGNGGLYPLPMTPIYSAS